MSWWPRFLEWFRPSPRYASQVRPIEPFDAGYLAVLHNDERAKVNLAVVDPTPVPVRPAPLLLDSRLNIDAMARATHAAAVNLTAAHLHDGFAPRPGDVKDGENAAMGQADAVSVMADWMGSPGHRANILDPQFKRVGFGRATSDSGVTYWYAIFAG